MINICVNYDDNCVEIEGQEPFTEVSIKSIGTLIKVVLDKAYYSGERLCLETKRDGNYSEIERWSF